MSGCAPPVDLSSFTKDKEVADIIEKGAGTVYITDDSAPEVIEGNQKITGLDPDKYYMVEEWDERSKNGDPPNNIQFVSANGQRSATPVNIGLVSNGEVTGLTNRYRYRVRSAAPLPGNVPYSVLTSPGSTHSAPNTNGAIYLPEPEENSVIVYVFTPPSDPPYEIIEIPISPAGSARSAMRPSPNGDIITLISQETVIDYVFFSEEFLSFYVLRVISGEDPNTPPEPGELIITVTINFTGDNPPQLDTTPITYPQNDNTPVTFTVSNSAQYDAAGIIWYIDGAQVGTGASFSLNKDLLEYKIVGVYTITVEASKDGIPYTAAIEVTVLP